MKDRNYPVILGLKNHYIDCKKGTPADKWVIPW